jgi:hypothetical protein
MAKNDIKSLRELAEVVTRNKVKSIQVLSRKDSDSKIYSLYDQILDGTFKDDTLAAKSLYDDTPHDPQYRKLKNRLKEKLINSSFFIDVNSPRFNSHQAAFYTCMKNLMAVRILIGRYARTPAIEIAEDTLKKSIRFEFSEISFELAKILRAHYAIHDQNNSSYKRYAAMAETYKEISFAEDLMAEKYDHVCITTKKSNGNEVILKLIEKYEKEVEPYLNKIKSYRLHLLYYFLILKKLDIESRPSSMISVCDKAISFFSSKGFVSIQFVGAFYYRKLTALIQSRDFQEASTLAVKCSNIFEENSIRWFNAQSFCFIFTMHFRKYRKALAIREKVVNSKSFQNQFQNRDETWKTYEAYLYYLSLSNKLNSPKTSFTTSFRLKRFLNEVPVFSTDKSGFNIPILVVQILIQIQQKKFDQLTDKIEAIEKYSSRYLRKDNNYRSNCFIKMLLQIPKQHFHRVAVERHTKSLRAKLEAMPLEKANQPFEIEIIPYEDLWEMALESLGN